MRIRRRRLKPMLPPTYVTLAECQQAGVTVDFDLLVPADKKRVAEHGMQGFDDLPAAIRAAIKNAVADPVISLVGPPPEKHNYTSLAHRLLSIGRTPDEIVRAIQSMDAQVVHMWDQQRAGKHAA